MKKLTNDQKIKLILSDLSSWIDSGDSDCSMAYAFRNGFNLHAASLWLGSGAMSSEIEKQVEGVKINRRAEMKEIQELCKAAFIYICPDCNHHAFLDADEGETVTCLSCLNIARREVKK